MDNIKDKIRKLLALAEGQANEHESARAMELASQLMMNHGIERDQLGVKSTIIEGPWFTEDQKWQRFCAFAASALYGCGLVRSHTGFKFAGRSENVDAAQDTCAFIILQVDALYKAHRPKATLSVPQEQRGRYRKEFKEACAMRVWRRCDEISRSQQASATGNALVIHRDALKKEVNDFLGKYKKATKTRLPAMRATRGMLDGTSAGNKVDIHRNVKANGAQPQLMH